MRFLYFLFFFFSGLGLIRYRERVQSFTGSFPFAEKYLGQGGTYHFLLLLGIATCILSIMYISGTLDGLIENTFWKNILPTSSPVMRKWWS